MAEQLDPFDALKRRYTRRDLLKMSGRGGMSLAALSLLAACSSGTDTGSGPSVSPSALPPLAKQLSVAQWPLGRPPDGTSSHSRTGS